MSANLNRDPDNRDMRRRLLHVGLILCLCSVALSPATQETVTADGVRSVTDVPADFDPTKPSLLILYACPNGNSIEMTMGAKLEPGMDWHYDIQHIAAQTRRLRQIDRQHNIILAVVEADTKSWAAWRKAHGEAN